MRYMSQIIKRKDKKIVSSLAWCLIGYLCTILVMTAVISLLISNETIGMDALPAISVVCAFASSLLVHGAFVCCKTVKIIQSVGISVAMILGMTVMLTLVFFGGTITEGWGILAAITLGGIVSVAGKFLIPTKSKCKKYRTG